MRFLKAELIHNGHEFIKEDILILNDDNTVHGTEFFKNVKNQQIEEHSGIMTPGFINAHCHLELSYLSEKIAPHTGLVNFVEQIMKVRTTGSEVEKFLASQEALEELMEEGIVAVGDICNTLDTLALKSQSSIYFHNFFEVSGFKPDQAEERFHATQSLCQHADKLGAQNMKSSVTPHSPYSCSTALIDLCTHHYPALQSIHNQESIDEQHLYESGTGRFIDFYTHLGVDMSHFKPTNSSSITAILPHLTQSGNVLLVHNTFTQQSDVDMILKSIKHPYFVLCPTANLYIENTLPDVPMLWDLAPHTLCLGTDSLASNSRLSILSEMNVLLDHFEELDLSSVIRMATYNGACALRIDDQFGSFAPGKKPGVNIINNETELIVLV